jgi:hypothetical protein
MDGMVQGMNPRLSQCRLKTRNMLQLCMKGQRTSKAIDSKLSSAKYLLLLSSGRLGLFLRRRLYLSDLKVHTTAMTPIDRVMLPPVSFRGILCLDPRQISDVSSSLQHMQCVSQVAFHVWMIADLSNLLGLAQIKAEACQKYSLAHVYT